MKLQPFNKIKLYGFNNLTKTLSFNLYDICYAKTIPDRKGYIEYIDEQYNAERLTTILSKVSNIIGAHILNIAKQDYEPQGASVTMLISEEEVKSQVITPASLPDTIIGHLDKSHITVHTYPENHPDDGISTFRADIDVSTCGHISPLKALNYLINSFNSDIITIDYRVRGFTRDTTGKKLFIDHEIHSIQDYIAWEIRRLYHMVDVNLCLENIFHTKMILKQFDLNNYLFGTTTEELLPHERKKIKHKLKKEMSEIFYGKNIYNISEFF